MRTSMILSTKKQPKSEKINIVSKMKSIGKLFAFIASKTGATGKNLSETQTLNENNIPITKNSSTVFLTSFNR